MKKTEIKIAGKIVANQEELHEQGINLDNPNKPLISGNVTQPISINQTHRGRLFRGSVEDILKALQSAEETEEACAGQKLG